MKSYPFAPGLLLVALMLLAGSQERPAWASAGDASAAGGASVAVPATQPLALNERCPVMPEEAATAAHELVFRGKAVRFCCRLCKDRFVQNPDAYLARLPHISAEAAPQPTVPEAWHSRWLRMGRAAHKWADEHRKLLGGTLTALAVHALARRWYRRSQRRQAPLDSLGGVHSGVASGRRPPSPFVAAAGHPLTPLLVLAGAVVVATRPPPRGAVAAPPDPHLERSAARFVADMARQGALEGPELIARLDKTYYRGNDDRAPSLFNGGIYRTCDMRVSLRDDDGKVVEPGMNVAGRRLFVRLAIERAPNALEFSDGMITGVGLMSREAVPSIPRRGGERAARMLVEVPGQRWVGACPIGDITAADVERLDGLVLLVPGYLEHSDAPQWPAAQYGIQYHLRIEKGIVSGSSKLWLGALLFNADVPDDRLYEWLSRDPLPTIPDGFRPPESE